MRIPSAVGSRYRWSGAFAARPSTQRSAKAYCHGVDDQEGRYWWDNNWLMVAENKGSDYTSASGIEKIEE